ncbi:MAG: hypothetical protein HY791_17920 [Deltaproteobacteria bacterium]|nr:hypothetical protein [Deltaproteobacteria bacterium]
MSERGQETAPATARSLRENVLTSIAALLVVGAIRPAFHTVVQRTFGPEANGHAATLVSLIFLASLPATASIPTMMVRHVSLARGAGREDEARAHVALASIAALALGLLGAVAAPSLSGWLGRGPVSGVDVWIVLAGIAGYTYWRLVRSLFVATSQAALGLRSDLISVLALPIGLGAVIVTDQPTLVVLAYDAVFLTFVAVTVHAAAPWAKLSAISPEARASFLRYNGYGLVGYVASLAAREISTLVLDGRAPRGAVGDFSLALSFLTLLAFAPRVLELPLIHELASMSGKNERERARTLTELSLHRLFIIVLSVSAGAAILAGPLLSLAGAELSTTKLAFALLAFAFGSEMAQSPAANLLISDAHPRVLALLGSSSLVAACLWWWIDPVIPGLDDPMLRVVLGLCASHAVKTIAIGGLVAIQFRVRSFTAPLRKSAALVLSLGAVTAAQTELLHPFIVAAIYTISMLALFRADFRALATALLSRNGDASTNRD